MDSSVSFRILVICSNLVTILLATSPAPTFRPTFTPSYSPTPIPTPVTTLLPQQSPIAPHQLIVVPATGNSLIQLKFYDPTTTLFQYKVKSPPGSGSLFQLSQVFSNYGYEPKNGLLISANDTVVTGSLNRVYYSRPTPDVAGINKWTSFDYVVVRKSDGAISPPGTVTIVPPSGAIIGSNFLTSGEDWTITGNKGVVETPSYERYSRGALLNYYIVGTDNVINVQTSGESDQSLWYFEAPMKYYGNYGIAYGGLLEFTLGSFAGDFTKLNDGSVNAVILECEECIGPVGKGITLAYSIASLFSSPNGKFDGSPKRFTLPLKETAGWMKDPQDSLKSWYTPSQCDMIQVLSRLSKVRILGDWTTWYETVALDNVQISNKQGQVPICAMSLPDASICTC